MSFKLPSSYFWEFHFYFFFPFAHVKVTFCRYFILLFVGKLTDWWLEFTKSCVLSAALNLTGLAGKKKIEIAIKSTKLLKCFAAYLIQETPKFNLSHQPYQKEHLLKCVVCVSITSKFLLLFFSKDSSGFREFSPSDVFQNLFKIFKVFCGGKRPIVWITWLRDSS